MSDLLDRYYRMTEIFFLTGLPRTGTTWVYQALAAGSGSEKVYEPFNYKWHPDRSRYHMRYLAPGSRHPDFLNALHEEIQKTKGNRIFIKEVHACLGAEYVWAHLQAQPIILLRHPCAMAASWLRLGFEAGSRLRSLLAQPEVVEEFLAPYLRRLQSARDPFFEIGAYWGAAYFCLRRISDRHPEWQWTTHERLCLEMEPGFAGLLACYNIRWQEEGSRYLREHDHRPEADHPHQQVRLSAGEPDRWRLELSPEQAEAVLEGARGFGLLERYYPSREK
jgi:hypothetical protein